jgi:hypothetical protein
MRARYVLLEATKAPVQPQFFQVTLSDAISSHSVRKA